MCGWLRLGAGSVECVGEWVCMGWCECDGCLCGRSVGSLTLNVVGWVDAGV